MFREVRDWRLFYKPGCIPDLEGQQSSFAGDAVRK
jgi:hypothetical protein